MSIIVTYGGLDKTVFSSTGIVPLYVVTLKEEGMAMCNMEMPPRYRKMNTTSGTAAGILI